MSLKLEVLNKLQTPNFKLQTGFTYVEILVTLTLMAVLFIPMMQLFAHAMEGSASSKELITAINLARWEMERSKNLGGSTARLKALGDVMWPPENEESFPLNGMGWRIQRRLKPESDPLEVTVEVQREGQKKPIVRLVTLLTDTYWTQKR